MLKLQFTRRTTVILISFILLLSMLYYIGFRRYSTGVVTQGQNQVLAVLNFLSESVSDFFSLYLTKADLASENEYLQSRIIELAKENSELKIARNENEKLRRELDFLDEFNYSYVIARVIGHGIDFDTSDILINHGSNHGLAVGYPVTTDQGVIIGTISKVEPTLSHVRLLTDNKSKLASVIATRESSLLGLAQGQHNINLKVTMLPKGELIEEGDILSTSGLDPNIPTNLLIGRVSKVYHAEESFWQEAFIKPAVDYSSVRLVTVIIPEL